MRLRGFRSTDSSLLTGNWLPGELMGLPPAGRPALAEPAVITAPADDTEELCVVTDVGVVLYTEIDWVHRRARLETGFRQEAGEQARRLMSAAVEHGFRVLNMRRLYGWVTPAAAYPVESLEEAGFRREASIPCGIWLNGRSADRDVWGAVRHD